MRPFLFIHVVLLSLALVLFVTIQSKRRLTIRRDFAHFIYFFQFAEIMTFPFSLVIELFFSSFAIITFNIE